MPWCSLAIRRWRLRTMVSLLTRRTIQSEVSGCWWLVFLIQWESKNWPGAMMQWRSWVWTEGVSATVVAVGHLLVQRASHPRGVRGMLPRAILKTKVLKWQFLTLFNNLQHMILLQFFGSLYQSMVTFWCNLVKNQVHKEIKKISRLDNRRLSLIFVRMSEGVVD